MDAHCAITLSNEETLLKGEHIQYNYNVAKR